MTPVGHGAVAYTLSATHANLRRWPVVLALLIGAVLPDIDFIAFWSPHFNRWHRVVTHNLLFVAGVALIGAVVARARHHSAAPVFAALVLGGLSHLVVDSMLDSNPSNGIGVAYLWPFIADTFSPVNLVATTSAKATWAEPSRMVAGVARGLVFELPFVIVGAWLYARRRSRNSNT